MKRSVTYSVLAAAIFSALSFPAFAADNADSNVTTKDVVVTATRTEEEVKNVPNTVEVITSQNIENRGATNVYDALRLADNVNVSMSGSDGFGHRVSLRGMGSNGTLILVNGRRVSVEDTPTTQNMMTLDRINVHNIDRIEIVRGAASSQYGADALAGVINIITKTSSGTPSTTIGVSTGTESTNNYYNFDFGKKGKLSGALDVNVGKQRKFILGDEGAMSTLYGPTRTYNFTGQYDVTDKNNIRLDLGYTQRNLRGDWGMTQPAKMNDKQRDISLSYNGKTDKSDYTVRAFYTKLDKYRFLPYTAFDPFAPKKGEDNQYSIFGIEGHDSIQLNDNHLLTVGAEYNKFKVDGDNFTGNGALGYDTGIDGADTTTYAAYLQDEWMVGDKLLLIPAVRYDHNSRFGSKTSPKIGATYFVNNHARIKANWGKGYKAPTVSELYMDMYHMMTLTKGNPDLRPETTDNWDVSFEGELGKSFGKVTYFNNNIDNMISTHTVPMPGWMFGTANQYYNIDGTTKTHGVELTLGHHFNDNWTLKATSNWTSATNSTAGRGDVNHGVDGVADNITTLALMYDDQNPNGFGATLWSQWYTNYNAEVSTGRNQTAMKAFSYNTLNFSVNKKFANGARIYAGLDNILDTKEYAVNLYGRMWRVGAEVKF